MINCKKKASHKQTKAIYWASGTAPGSGVQVSGANPHRETLVPTLINQTNMPNRDIITSWEKWSKNTTQNLELDS